MKQPHPKKGSPWRWTDSGVGVALPVQAFPKWSLMSRSASNTGCTLVVHTGVLLGLSDTHWTIWSLPWGDFMLKLKFLACAEHPALFPRGSESSSPWIPTFPPASRFQSQGRVSAAIVLVTQSPRLARIGLGTFQLDKGTEGTLNLIFIRLGVHRTLFTREVTTAQSPGK